MAIQKANYTKLMLKMIENTQNFLRDDGFGYVATEKW
jgi:hypothetical protein